MDRKIVYCHFSFRRPKGKDYGIFAVALYADEEGKILIAQKTRAIKLWKNHQHITAIQAYENAMYTIWEWQYNLKNYNVTNVLLVTDNSTLAGWIIDPKKNKKYTDIMLKATYPYKVGSPREIGIAIGLCEPRDYEKSHKFCREELVVNKSVMNDTGTNDNSNFNKSVHNNFGIETSDGIKTALDIVMENEPDGLYDIKEV